MEIVVYNGSPNRNGLTNKLVNHLLDGINANVKYYYAYNANIKSCTGCEYCFKNPYECIIKDDFQIMMQDFINCDVLILASPLHFSCFSGEFLAKLSRLQYAFAIKYIHKLESEFKRKKAITLISAGNNYPNMFQAVENIDRLIFSHVNASKPQRMLINDTDKYSYEELIDIHKNLFKENKDYINNLI